MPPKRQRISKVKVVIESNGSPQFTSSENSIWYNERKLNTLLVESLVSEELDRTYHILDLFDTFGWVVLFDLPDSIYDSLVREFYANMEDKSDMKATTIRTTVQGISIELTVDVLSTILGVEKSGGFFDVDRECMRQDSGFDHIMAFDYFNVKCVNSLTKTYLVAGKKQLLPDKRERSRWPATSFCAQERAILYLLHHNVVPAAHESGVKKRDIYLLYRMLVGLDGLPKPALAPIIIQCMRRVMSHKGKTFIYPRVLTLVFQYFRVPLASNISQDCSKKIFNSAILKRMCVQKPRRVANIDHQLVGKQTWQDWALHFDARLDHHEGMLKRQEDLLMKILRKLGESDADGSSASPSSS